MASFRYSGRNAEGGKVAGIIDANSADAVATELLAKSVTPLTIEEQDAVDADVFAAISEMLRSKTVDLDEQIIFCRQMYSLAKAGVPIIRAIAGLGESNRNRYFREVLQKVRSDLEGGVS
ncbi:MAG: type II secretion system F family protein, partial [Pseudomonas sp.]|nr:type II secretion system F family protein [Pseudomonas sp.]